LTSNVKTWILQERITLPENFSNAIGGHPIVAETLYQRGYREIASAKAFLDPACYHPTSPKAFPDLELALEILENALETQQEILVWGDFDVDGQTATTLLVEALRELGGRVAYHIPVRGKESHGISQSVLEVWLERGFDVLITCDTGISEHENIQMVRNAGKTVIVTDHHSLSESLPPAHAVINPQRLRTDHPLRTLPGVGVAYKLMEGLFSILSRPFDEGHFLELVALGIVADVADLHGDTRYLLQKGLANLHYSRRVGLQFLYQNAGLNPQYLDEDHIGFQIAPRLNAIGRLGDANPMVEFLSTDNRGRARVLANQIEAMNTKRRFATRQVEKAAETKLQASPDDRHAPAIVLYHPDWPGGVVGIVASRLVERYQKPVILLTGRGILHGSARSVPGINITKAIASQSRLLKAFGGHPMAAGLSLDEGNLFTFKAGFFVEISERAKAVEIRPEISITQNITLESISSDFIAEIDRLAPFGAGNPPLNFLIKDLSLVSTSTVGGEGEHRQAVVEDESGNQGRFIWWNGGDEALPEAQFDLVCRLSLTDYKGSQQVSAEWVDFRLSEKGKQELSRQAYRLEDLRLAPQPLQLLLAYLEENPNAAVWGEGALPEEVAFQGRHELEPSQTLVIWTPPPSQEVLRAVIRQTKPEKIIVFAVEPKPSSYQAYMERLAGLAKYAGRDANESVNLKILANACAVNTEAIRVGLHLWQAMGKIKVAFDENNVKITLEGNTPDSGSIQIYQNILETLLEEIQAYRHYFQTGDLQDYFKLSKE